VEDALFRFVEVLFVLAADALSFDLLADELFRGAFIDRRGLRASPAGVSALRPPQL
jgi:hypothetical protein